MLDHLVRDLRYAVRALRRAPLFTLTAVVSLGIGIAGNAAIFSVADALFVRGVSGIRDASALVEVAGREEGVPGLENLSYPNYADLRDRNTVFDGLAAVQLRGQPFGVSSDAIAESVHGMVVSGNYFDVLGLRMSLGRGLRPDDDRVGAANPVVVISNRLWRRLFQSDPYIVGRSIRVNNQPVTIVGVGPPGFIGHNIATSDLWIPVTLRPVLNPGDRRLLTMRNGSWLIALGRVKAHVSFEQARSDMDRIARDLEREYPSENRNRRVAVSPWGPLPSGGVRDSAQGFVVILFALVALILLIACTNVGGMLLARGAMREREVALRLAIGAARAQVVRMLIKESALLAGAGCILGIAGAAGLIQILRQALPIALPLSVSIAFSLDERVVAFSSVLSIIAALTCGLLPAMHTARADLVPSIGTDRAARGFRRMRMRQLSVVAQAAMSLLLVVVALLLARSLANAARIDPGFSAENVEVTRTDLRLGGYDETRGSTFANALVSRVERLPGVASAAWSRVLPLLGEGVGLGTIRLPGASQEQSIRSDWNAITPRYFETLGIPLLRGRVFTANDTAGSMRVAIVNETLAKRAWPLEDPIGQTLISTGTDGEQILQVVGVARDAKYRTLGEAPRGFIYVPLAQFYQPDLSLLVRTDGYSTLNEIRRAIRELDPGVPVVQAVTLSDLTAFNLVPHRIAGWTAASVALIGLLLAAIGIYGIAAYSVTQRTREIGIRLALGALRRNVLAMVVRQSLSVVVVGGVIGLVAATLGSRLLSTLLYGVQPVDPLSFAVATLLLATTAILATVIPATSAANVNPAITLRSE